MCNGSVEKEREKERRRVSGGVREREREERAQLAGAQGLLEEQVRGWRRRRRLVSLRGVGGRGWPQ